MVCISESILNISDITVFVEQCLVDNKAEDIKILDVKGLSDVADTMIVATGTSSRHVKSLAEHVVVDCKKEGISVLGHEGQSGGEWVLVDLGEVLIHVMQLETREFYQLEKLWQVRPNSV